MRDAVFTAPPPRQSTSISTREKIMTCDSINNSENSIDDILRTNVETTWIPCEV